MVLELSSIRGTIVITLPRRFDMDSAPSVENELQPVIGNHPEQVLFDLSKTDYISSARMRVLLKSVRSLNGDGAAVAFSSPCRQAEYVLEIAGFTKIFKIYKTRDKALEHMNRKN